MSLDQFMQYSTGGTALNEQTSPGSAIEFSQSPLIEDSETNKFFSTFFGSTSLHQDPQRVDPFGFNQQSEGMHTPLLNEGLLVTVRAWRAKSHLIEERNPFNRSNDDRLTLLARKYVAQESFPDEEMARLAIVTERVRQLLPSVTANEYESLEKTLLLINRVADADIEIRTQIGYQP